MSDRATPTPVFRTDCRHFDGYSPCRHRRMCQDCPDVDPITSRVLVINLDNLGDVARNTALIAPLRRADPGAHITWLTSPRARPLLDHVPGLDRPMALQPWTEALLRTLRFDRVLGLDKSLAGGSLTMAARAERRLGFGLDEGGAIVPLDPGAERLYRLGLDDDEKFLHNRRTHLELLSEVVELPFARDPYGIALSADEERAVARWREERTIGGGRPAVGFNTGSSPKLASKRLTVGEHARLVDGVARRCPDAHLALLGGPEDTDRNLRIAEACTVGRPECTETEQGLRVGMLRVAGCDLVVSGDSLGMHLAIGLGRPVVAWFGPTCHQEIDLYGRGVWALADVPCRPCYRGACDEPVTCHERAPVEAMIEHAAAIADTLRAGKTWEGEVLVGTWPRRVARRVE